MPDEKELFQTTGTSWSERAKLGELDAVLTGCGNHARNTFLHHTQVYVARRVRRSLPRQAEIVDFGCGTGRFLRYFAADGHRVTGTEVTREMLEETRRLGLPAGCQLALTDGIHIPVADGTVDLIWVCSVLRYSLNVPTPVYADIAREMFRALKPGGRVVNVEMYVDQPASDFTRDFERAGFVTTAQRVVNRHTGRPEQLAQRRRLPLPVIAMASSVIAALRYRFDSATAVRPGLRDYVFTWTKPAVAPRA